MLTQEQIDALPKMLAEATPGPWSGHNMVHSETGQQLTPEELGEYVCNTVKMGDQTRFLFVSGKHDDGGDCDVCHTGNGPRGPYNTALIALAPSLAATVIEQQRIIAQLSEDASKAAELAGEVERLREALTPSGDTKAEYIGEFSFSVERGDEGGEPFHETFQVPWTTIKEIMAAIRARAALDAKP